MCSRYALADRNDLSQTTPGAATWQMACSATLKLLAAVLAIIAAAFPVGTTAANTILVGPYENINRIADAARIAQDGDTILIMPGEYRGDVALWTQSELTIRGVGERPVLIADGHSAEDKAIWVFRNGHYTVENIEFRGARVADGNGAGIRFERGRLHVRNSVFEDNQNGILTANFEDSELIIEDSLFNEAPRQTNSLPHLLYVGRIARLEVTGSRFHRGHHGHLIKSRARETTLRYNLILDGTDGAASYEVDLPNGGNALLVGNIIGQSKHTENPVVIAYGAEGNLWPENTLRLSHNTLISERLSGAWFLRVFSDRLESPTVTAINNLTAGIGLFTLAAPGDFSGNFPLPPWVLDPATLQFHLTASSLLRDRARLIPEGDPMRPVAEFNFPIGTMPLEPPARWAPGALQREY